ncbi:MAG TPA: T9SS type A sorting domain-containing protein [Chitinophagales bacterium]|nr:T9SS type A sorting domain-containing protein [Chitinophagales bacterium]
MKGNYLLLLFCCIAFFGRAQTSFARQGAHWCTNYLSLGGIQYGEPWSAVDTVIMGIPCSYVGNYGLFVKNDTVYRILQDGSILFVYDYSAHKGDVWKIELRPQDYEYFEPNYTQINVLIDSAYTINVRGQILRVFNTSVIDTINQFSIFHLDNVVEGVGGSHSFLPGPWGLVDLGVPYLQCYQDSMTGAFIFSNNNDSLYLLDSCICHVWMGQNEMKESIKFSVSPNPAGNMVTVLIDEYTTEAIVSILDLTGRKIIHSQLLHGTTQLSTENLPNGLYFVTVKSGHNTSTRRLVIQK